MLKKMILLVIATTTMLAPVALADHDRGRYRPANRVAVLSDDLVDAARHMQRDAERRLRGRGYRSGDLLLTLDDLTRQARRFRDDVMRGSRPRLLDVRFERLLVAFDRTERRMRFVRSGRLQHDFDRVQRVMRSLVRNVEVARGPRDRRDRDGLHGAIVLGDRDGRFRARIRF